MTERITEADQLRIRDILSAEYTYDELQQIAGTMRHETQRRFEIEGMFRDLSECHWDEVADALWQKMHVWSITGQAFQKTPEGLATRRRWVRARSSSLRQDVTGSATCQACGKTFARTAFHDLRKTGVVCSHACRSRSRKNIKMVTIDGVACSLSESARRLGLNPTTIRARVRRGWSVEKALVAGDGRPKGASHSRSKVTPEKVAAILAATGSHRAVAREMKLDHKTVRLVRAGKGWAQRQIAEAAE